MVKFLVKKLKQWNDFLKTKTELNKLFLENHEFLSKIPEESIEDFFNYIVNYYAKNIVSIKYNNKIVNLKEINIFFNIFFSKYEKIIIGPEHNVVISLSEFDDNCFEDVIIIGKDEGASIFIKKNGIKNGIFIDELDLQSDIDIEDSLYQNIYYYMIRTIFAHIDIKLVELYLEFKERNKE